MLTELELRGRIRSAPAKNSFLERHQRWALPLDIQIADESPTGDELLDACLTKLQGTASPGHTTVPKLTRAMWRFTPGKGYSRRLVDAHWFVDTGAKTLVRRRPKYRVCTPAKVNAMRVALFESLLSDDEWNDRDGELVALLVGAGTDIRLRIAALLPQADGEAQLRHERNVLITRATPRAKQQLNTHHPIAAALYVALINQEKARETEPPV